MSQDAARCLPDITASIDAASLVAGHTGPACLFDADRQPLVANPMWLGAGLPGVPAPGDDAPLTLPGELVIELASTAATKRPGRANVRLSPGASRSNIELMPNSLFEFTILPVESGDAGLMLVLGTDRTAMDILQNALKESRDFHRAFASCSADFIWQVDAAGVIDYVGPRGLLDFSPDDVFGATIAEFYTDPGEADASLVFQGREPIWEREVWLSERKGASHCFLVSSVPVYDADGQWCGARGVGRDVTEQRAREAELKKARFSQRMVDSVLHAMRSEVDPRAILDSATIVAADTSRLDGCLVARLNSEQKAEWIASTLPGPLVKAMFEKSSEELLAKTEAAIAGADYRLMKFNTPEAQFLIAATWVDGKNNGAIVFVRLSGAGIIPYDEVWSLDDEHILRAMTEQLGVSLAQYQLVEDLKHKTARAHAV